MNKIYTKTGDQGQTGLRNQKRVWKDSLLIEVLGTLDELNSALGVAYSFIPSAKASKSWSNKIKLIIRELQKDLLDLGSLLSKPFKKEKNTTCLFTEKRVRDLEKIIDRLEEDLPALDHFIFPGDTPSSSFLHLARSISRRAERRYVSLSKKASFHPIAIRYLNRLSDALFVLARWTAKKSST